MKNSFTHLIVFFFVIGFMAIAQNTQGDAPSPPSGGHGQGGNQGPAGAPIDGGLSILMALGAGYGGLKLYKSRKTVKTEVTARESED